MSINYKLLADLGAKKKNHELGISWFDIAEQCGIHGPASADKARHTANRLINKQYNDINIQSVDEMTDADIHTSNEINSNGTYTDTRLIELSEDDKKSPDILLEKHGFDKTKFELISAKNSIWNVAKKNSNDNRVLYSSKITVKSRTNNISFDALKEDFINYANQFDGKQNQIKTLVAYPSDYMLEINIADLHLGKLCHKLTTGSEYNTKIASQMIDNIIDNIITEVNSKQFEKILFVFSNDFLNYDTLNYTTTKGTPQSYDTNWQQVFQDGCHILINTIEKLKQLAPVETLYIGSNHDRQTSYYLSCYLSAWFRNDPNVSIDDTFMQRKIVKWGKSLIYFMHGDMPKNQINGIIAREYPKEFGESLFREIHAAHYHSEQSIIESCGTICRFLPSVTGTDVYHYDNGYTGAIAKTQSFIWSKTNGLKTIINTNAMI